MKPYWHSIGDDIFASIMMNNTRLCKGFLSTGDLLSSIIPPGAIISRYSNFTNEKPKEDVWEKVRLESVPHLPTRKDALFLFDDEIFMRRALESWWAGQNRQILRAHVLAEKSKLHRADAKWLDCTKEKWGENAHAYWSGVATDDPIFEVVVQGIVIFPDWETFPLFI